MTITEVFSFLIFIVILLLVYFAISIVMIFAPDFVQDQREAPNL